MSPRSATQVHHDETGCRGDVLEVGVPVRHGHAGAQGDSSDEAAVERPDLVALSRQAWKTSTAPR